VNFLSATLAAGLSRARAARAIAEGLLDKRRFSRMRLTIPGLGRENDLHPSSANCIGYLQAVANLRPRFTADFSHRAKEMR
jgi:hypothetical protein